MIRTVKNEFQEQKCVAVDINVDINESYQRLRFLWQQKKKTVQSDH